MKIRDYSILGEMENLQTLILCSYQTREDVMTMDSDGFAQNMKNLRYLDLRSTKIIDRQFLDPETAERFDFACFPVE